MLRVSGDVDIDYEKNQSFILTVQATDHGILSSDPSIVNGTEEYRTTAPKSSTVNVTIDVLDVNEQPTVYAMNFTVPENIDEGYQIGIINGSDPDIFADQYLSFYINNEESVFLLENPSGNAWFARLLLATGSTLDYELQPQHQLMVCVHDNGGCLEGTPCGCSGDTTNSFGSGMSYTTKVVVQVEDRNDAPHFHCNRGLISACDSYTIAENSPNGLVVGKVNCSDQDGDALHFVLISEDGKAHSSHFHVEPSNGSITVALRAGAKLDYEAKSSYILRINVTDYTTLEPGNMTVSQTFIINVKDVNEAPVYSGNPNTALKFGVDETASEGYTFGVPLLNYFTDPEGKDLFFDLAAFGKDAADLFEIEQTTGQLSGIPISRLGCGDSYRCLVKVSDKGLLYQR